MSKTKNGNEKKRGIVQRLTQEINSHQNSFSIFRQEEAIDSYSLDCIRADVRKEGIKIIFIPNRILKIALSQNNIHDDRLNALLKNNNFIVLSNDSIKSTSLAEYIKDKKLRTKIQVKAIILNNNLIDDRDKIEFMMRAKSENGIKVIILQSLRSPAIKFLRTLHARQEQINSLVAKD
jgi:ribosomal protein L10